MTKEQEEAIKYLRNYKYTNEVKEAIDIVLSMLEEKDKQIDLMAEFIEERLDTCPFEDYNYNLNCEKECNDNYIRCWKQYFEDKARQESDKSATGK